MTDNEINTLENKAFRLECEILQWRLYRKEVESFLDSISTFGTNTPEELERLKKVTEEIRYL
jgi:hypothetical protein